MLNPVAPTPRKIYGRRAKRLSESRKTALARLPEFEIKLPANHGALNARDLFTHFTPASRLHLEIGFGGGEHVAALAQSNPQDGFLAVEPYITGFANLMRMVVEDGHNNIRLYNDDGLALMEALLPASIDAAYLLFPDPWPKARHHERRFIQPASIAEFARVLKAGGKLLIGSDDVKLVDWMLRHMLAAPQFCWQAKGPEDWQNPPPGHILSRYAEKAREAGRGLHYLTFIKQ